MALFLKLVCSFWMIQHLILLKLFVVRFSDKSFLNEGLEYGCLSRATIAEFLEPSLRVVLMYA